MELESNKPEGQTKILGFRYDDDVLPFCTIYRIHNTESKETILADMQDVLKLRSEIYVLDQEKKDYIKEAERTCKALEEQLAKAKEARQEKTQPVQLPEFAQEAINKLRRFEACASDGQNADIGREWFDTLTHLGLLDRIQRSPGRWQITDQGQAVLNSTEDDKK